MKITPLEIRQKAFEKVLRGYDKDEVNAFLLTLSQEWERLLDETKEARMKVETTEREVAKLREVESSLFKTLKTAELILRENQLNADAILSEAKTKARNTIEEAEMLSRQMLDEMEERLKLLGQHYKTLELHRDNLLSDLKRLAGETIDRVERAKTVARYFDPDQHLALAKRESKKTLFPNAEIEKEIKSALPPITPAPAPVEEPVKVTATTTVEHIHVQKSFFDDIQ